MKTLLLDLLNDPFGLSDRNLKVLLQIVEDDYGEAAVKEIEAQITEVEINRAKRNVIGVQTPRISGPHGRPPFSSASDHPRPSGASPM